MEAPTTESGAQNAKNLSRKDVERQAKKQQQEMDKKAKEKAKQERKDQRERKEQEKQNAIERKLEEVKLKKLQRIDEVFKWDPTGSGSLALYAASRFFEIEDPGRIWSLDGPPKSQPDNNWSLTKIGTLLDSLAHLFARAKNPKNSSDPVRCPIKSSEDVTAIAIAGDGDDRSIIYITKNGGPQSPKDAISDEAFAKKLETWYNKLPTDSERLPTSPLGGSPDDYKIWRSMQEFWYYRLHYYASELKMLRCEIRFEGLDPPSYLDFQDTKIPQDDVKADWEHSRELLKEFSKISDRIDDQVALNKFTDYICLLDLKQWKRIEYPKHVGMEKDTSKARQDAFRKIVKHFQNIEILSLVWHSLVDFRATWQMDLSFRPLEVQPCATVTKESLAPIFDAWELDARENTHKKNFKVAHQKVNELGGIQRQTHCEMQFARFESDVPQTTWAFSPRQITKGCLLQYIGCSKYSCFLCWNFIGALGLHTRNTHGQLRCNCAFPLEAINEEKLAAVSRALRKMNELVLEYLPLKSKQIPPLPVVTHGRWFSSSPWAPRPPSSIQQIATALQETQNLDDQVQEHPETNVEEGDASMETRGRRWSGLCVGDDPTLKLSYKELREAGI